MDWFLSHLWLSLSKYGSRLRLIKARPSFYLISDNPKGSLGIVDSSLCLRRIALKDDYYKKKMDMLSFITLDNNYLESLAKTFIFPARKSRTSSVKKLFLTKLKFVEFPLQWTRPLLSLDQIPKIHSGTRQFDFRQVEILRRG